MDLDKSLDDMIPKRGPRADRGGRGGRGGAERKPRISRDRTDAAPYARPAPRSTEDKWEHDAFEGRGGRRGDDRRDRDRRPADEVVSSSPRIEISGLHYEVTPADLKTIFIQAGTIVQGPTIVYDRSGRSTGSATVEYASAQMAKVAINKFDGAMTKGQTISIKLVPPPRGPKTESTGSLLARLGAGSLKDRIGGESGSRDSSRRGGRDREERGPRPERGERGPRPERGERGGARGGRGRGGGGAARPQRKTPATTEDLDKELDGFMDKSGDVAME